MSVAGSFWLELDDDETVTVTVAPNDEGVGVSVMLCCKEGGHLAFLEPDAARSVGWAILEAAGIADHLDEKYIGGRGDEEQTA